MLDPIMTRRREMNIHLPKAELPSGSDGSFDARCAGALTLRSDVVLADEVRLGHAGIAGVEPAVHKSRSHHPWHNQSKVLTVAGGG